MTISKSIALAIFVSLILWANTNSTAQDTNAKTSKKEKANSSLASYEKYIDENMEAHQKEFIELVSIPSISSIPSYKPDAARTATWIVNKLKAIGMTTAQLIPTEGNPVVYGSWDKAPGKPTVLVYGHYDVQPAEPLELWTNPPFEPTIVDG